MLVRARAPLRISFGGGGTDVPPYCDEKGGAVLSATINRYASATLIPGGTKITIVSLDYDASVSFGIDDPLVYDGQLGLAKCAVDHFRRSGELREGLEIHLHNDAPPGSGLGSSSAITVALIRALAEYLRLPMDSYQIAELAYKIEREDVGIKGGKQDQYSSAFGGFNFIEFQESTTLVHSLRLRPETIDELEYSMVFSYVGGSRPSAHIIEKQVDNYKLGKAATLQAMETLKETAYEMRKALLLGRLQDLGRLLHRSWESKKNLAEGITTPEISELYDLARQAGALGGKLSGAGGGGFMYFICDPYKRFAVQNALKAKGAQLVHFSFVQEGVRSWLLR